MGSYVNHFPKGAGLPLIIYKAPPHFQIQHPNLNLNLSKPPRHTLQKPAPVINGHLGTSYMRSGDWKPNRFDRVQKYNHVCLRRSLLSQRDQFHKPFRTQEQLFVDMKPPEEKQTSGKRIDHSLKTNNH